MLGNLLGAAIGGISSLIGGKKSQDAQEKANAQNIQLQKDFAQQGIQWKVQDAKAAGIHPLYALGANTHSFAPVSVGDSMGPAIASAGQNLGRAVAATASGTERVGAISQAMQTLQLENASLNNDLLRSQIRRIDQQVGPPMPNPSTQWLIPGQGDTTIPNIPGTIIDKELKRSGVDPNHPGQESGSLPDVGYARTKYGQIAIPGADVKQRIEDIMPHEWMHYFRTNIAPMFGINKQPPPYPPLPPDHVWSYNPIWGYNQRKLYSRGGR